jgi:hypothetical protein
MIVNNNKFIMTLVLISVFIYAIIFLSASVYADTDGNELRITAQPDRLILQLGDDWAGAEFELKLDSAVFPVSVVVSPYGVLSMELGGSRVYTLTLIENKYTSEINTHDSQEFPISTESISQDIASTFDSILIESTEGVLSIPMAHTIILICVLVFAVAGVIIVQVKKKQSEKFCADEDDE